MRLNNHGQFMSISAMVLFTGVTLLWAVFNIYKVTRAKLQAQNMADAVALAIATLEARGLNVVLDRNEWLNHLYPANAYDANGNPLHKGMLPGISQLARDPHAPSSQMLLKGSNAAAPVYAQTIANVNQAQMLFINAYNQFLGVGAGTSSNGSGVGSLADILMQIDGLQQPNVRVVVFNNATGMSAAQGKAQQVNSQGAAPLASEPQISPASAMSGLPVKTMDVTVYDSKGNTPQTLTQLFNNGRSCQDNDPTCMKVGWMRPDWENSDGTMNVNVGKGQTAQTIGGGAIVFKQVSMGWPLNNSIIVQAKAIAYIKQTSGLDVDSTLSTSPNTPAPPPHFHPTYYVELGLK